MTHPDPTIFPDPRPARCRARLIDEGKPYPRSGCDVCGSMLKPGFGKSCRNPTTIAGYEVFVDVGEGDEIASAVIHATDLGAKFVCEVPADAGKLVASTVFAGQLFIAFASGVYVVKDGKAVKIVGVGGGEL